MTSIPISRRRLLATATAALAVPALWALPRPASAAEGAVFAPGGVAINGYDPVAYFTDARPVEGEARFASRWNGVEWRFASADNQAAFEADPARYAPQYGGYCAYAVANNYTASTDPDAWSVEDGKLYLNFSRGVRRRWLRDVPGHIAAGDANWPDVLAR